MGKTIQILIPFFLWMFLGQLFSQSASISLCPPPHSAINCLNFSGIPLLQYYEIEGVVYRCSNQASSSDDMPEWVKTRKSPKYPDKQYMVGVGEVRSTGNSVEDKKNADNDGYVQIGKQIAVNVSSENFYESYEVLSEGTQQYGEKSQSTMKISTYVELSGLTVAERYYDTDNEIYYSLTVLDRSAASIILKSKLQQAIISYEENMKLAGENISRGSVYQALLNLKESIRQVNLFNLSIPFYQIISKESNITGTFGKTINKNEAVNKFSEVISSLSIQKLSGEDQDVNYERPLDKPLQVKVAAGNGQAAEGILVGYIFVSGTGDIEEKIRTDNNGVASANVTMIRQGSHKEYHVKSFIDLSEFKDTALIFTDLNKLLGGYNKEDIFRLKKKDIYQNSIVLVQVEEISGTTKQGNKMISNILSQKLMENGMTAHLEDNSGNYTILISGSFTANPFNELSGIKIYNVSGTIKAVLKENGKTIAVENVQDVKGMGNTDEQASDNALKKAAEKFIDSFISQIVSGEFR